MEPGTDPRHSTSPSRDPPHPFRPLASAHLERVDRLAQDLLGRKRRRRIADQDATRIGQGLQPRRDVDHVAHRGVLRRAGHVADDDLARVDADAQLQRPIEVGLFLDESRERRVHLQRCANRPVGVVLMGHRGAEQGEDAIAEHLVDPAAEGGDVGDQSFEAGVDQPLDPLGVEVLGQGGVAHEVGEHDGDDTALFRDRRRHLLAARRAEPCAVGQRGVTRRAGGHQPVIVRHVHPQADHPGVAAE